MAKYIIKKEIMGGTWHYMIYRQVFWLFEFFVERWNTEANAKQRVDELNNPISVRVPYY